MDAHQWTITVIVVVVAMLVLALAVLLGYRWGRRTGAGKHGDAGNGNALAARSAVPRANGDHAGSRDGLRGVSSVFGEGTVRAAEEQFINVMPDMLVIVDDGGRIRYVSPAARNLALVGDTGFINDDLAQVAAMVAADGQTRDREITVDSHERQSGDHPGRGVKAGTVNPARQRHLLIHVGAIDGHRVAVFIRDISERRRFEMMRRDFVTNVSHELKTPAGAIALLAETITDAADDPDAVRYFSGRISKESERLTNLVQRLIELQRAESTSGIASAQQVDALDVVKDAAQQNAVQAEHKHIDIRVTHSGGPAAVRVDRRALTTAVKNLIENAIHYSPSDTTVTADVARHDAEGTVTIRVIDQGIGIPEQSLDRIFERFYRVDPARSRDTGGTGLGLAITKHCVEECGGTISAWSHEGSGSTFTIELPLDGDAGEADASDGAGAGAGDAVDAGAAGAALAGDHAQPLDRANKAEQLGTVEQTGAETAV